MDRLPTIVVTTEEEEESSSSPTTEKITTTEEACENECIGDYPYLASLTMPLYLDSKEERRYACSGVILGVNIVMVGKF